MAHNWQLVEETSPSGKLTYQCPICKMYSNAPVKAKYDKSLCEPDLYINHWVVKDGKVYANLNPSLEERNG